MNSREEIRSIVVGTAGHIDHGKTKLIKALTGIDTDRLAEEKRRGITIDLGFAPIDIGSAIHIGFVDVPGHERFVKNMLAGVGGIDAVLIVVAADESVMPQTREHVEICDLLGIGVAVVAITKTDLADEDTVELVALEVAELLEGTAFAGSPLVPVSSVTGDGLDNLKAALSKLAEKVRARSDTLLPRMPIDRVFTMKGFGTVVTGTLIAGKLEAGQAVEIFPTGKKSPVKGLQVHNQSVKEARAGHRVAINLSAVSKREIARGEVLSLPGALQPTSVLDLHCRLLPSSPTKLLHNQRVRFHIGSSELIGRVKILAGKEIAPGDSNFIRIGLEAPTAALVGDRFVIRRYSPMLTIGGGEIIDNTPEPIRGRRSELVERLKKILDADLPERIKLFVGGQTKPVSAARLTERFGLMQGEAEERLRRLAEAGDAVVLSESPPVVISSGHLKLATDGILGELEEAHRRSPLSDGFQIEMLRKGLPRGTDESIFRAAIEYLEREGKIRVGSGQVALSKHQVELSSEEQNIINKITGAFRAAGTAPPSASGVIAEQRSPGAKKLFKLLVARGELVKIADDLYYHRGVLDEVVSTIRKKVTEESFSVPEFKDWFGISRKYAIPLLEYLDAARITYRDGDARRLYKT